MRSRRQNNSRFDAGREIAELERGMDELGIAFGHPVLDKFRTYLRVLYAYYGKVHLLSHGDYERISRRHFLPSLIALPMVENHKRVCDVGSGAGFPSLPLKILLPDMELVIFEAQRKKADFLKHLIEELSLENVELVNVRAEEYSGRQFDLALLKAVGPIRKLIATLDLLLEPGAEAIFFKTLKVQEEISKAQKALHKYDFEVTITKTATPIEHLPLALVTLRKS